MTTILQTQPTRLTVIPTRLTALLFGNLVLVNDCLRVDPGYGASYLLVWPPEFQVRMENRIVHIHDALTGENVDWNIGETVTLGGGEIHRIDPGEYPLFSANCSSPYWLVGGIVVLPTVTPTTK